MILQLPQRLFPSRKAFELNQITFFCETKINFTKSGPLPTSKIELLVIIVDSLKVLTSVSSSLFRPDQIIIFS